MTWIAKQYPNRGVWQSENGDYDIYVNDDGQFEATCLCKRLTHQVHPHLFGIVYLTLMAAKGACTAHQALLGMA